MAKNDSSYNTASPLCLVTAGCFLAIQMNRDGIKTFAGLPKIYDLFDDGVLTRVNYKLAIDVSVAIGWASGLLNGGTLRGRYLS